MNWRIFEPSSPRRRFSRWTSRLSTATRASPRRRSPDRRPLAARGSTRSRAFRRRGTTDRSRSRGSSNPDRRARRSRRGPRAGCTRQRRLQRLPDARRHVPERRRERDAQAGMPSSTPACGRSVQAAATSSRVRPALDHVHHRRRIDDAHRVRSGWATLPNGDIGYAGMRPKLGLNPTFPQNAAGMRTLPPLGADRDGPMPEATAAPAPPDDPPGVFDVPGIARQPVSGESVSALWPNSGWSSCRRPWRRPRVAAPGAAHRASGSRVRCACRPASAIPARGSAP